MSKLKKTDLIDSSVLFELGVLYLAENHVNSKIKIFRIRLLNIGQKSYTTSYLFRLLAEHLFLLFMLNAFIEDPLKPF